MESMRKDGIYLPRLERDFQHRGETYKVTIRPARITGRDGMDKEYYPGPREELVEEALRKLACDRLNGVYLDDQAGVQFTIYELHAYSTPNLPLSPRQSCHLFHTKVATDSTGSLPLIPYEGCH
jgi:hypothetical protein